MASLLYIVFFMQLVIYLVNAIGPVKIYDSLLSLYSKLPIASSELDKRKRNLGKDVVRLKREMAATSSQDQFAKWAKLRRAHDKASAQYDELEALQSSSKTRVTSFLSIGWTIFSNGFRIIFQMKYARRPMYYIPKGWAPWYIKWLLSFPSAPMESVSLLVWSIACYTVISLVGSAVLAGYSLVNASRLEQAAAMKASKTT